MKGSAKIIGLCGRSGSGKGYVSLLFGDLGIKCIDTDAVYRDIIKNSAFSGEGCVFELSREFGRDILFEDGTLDKSRLRDVVFAEGAQDKLQKLNVITHKYILEMTLEIIEKHTQNGARAVLIDAPVLFESGFDKICDVIFCVIATDEACIDRICERDGIDRRRAKARLANQKSQEELVSLCDAYIVNDGSENVEVRVRELIASFNLLGGSNDKE